uniref:EGF-like domain-containing protein n=1 Tax=Plectus sambesii TaxID=2011161 RepID=A0A914WNS7_9BILA
MNLLTSESQSTSSSLTPTSAQTTSTVSEEVQTSSSSAQVFSSTMMSTTHDYGLCYSSACANNGTCVSSSNQHVCRCDIDHTGTLCESSINQCNSNPCQHHSTCIDRFGYYECICPSGYSGTNCENEINTCLSIPCQNGATCSHSFDFYSCKCKEKYTGYNCETEITICLSDPCANGGECSLVGGNRFLPPSGYRCDCAPGYKSTLCEEVMTSCNDKPCRSGGSCNPTATRFTCACPSGFTGLYCETNIDDCPSPDPCINGKCNDLIDAFSCNCTPGYTGVHCETEINECESSPCSTKDAKSTCLNLINQFGCVCGPDFTGQLCMNVVAQAENLIKSNGALSSVSTAGDDNNTLAVASTVSDALIFVAASLSVEERTSFSWTLDEMVDWCTYEGQDCDMKGHFASFNDPTMGNCYTFNSVSSTRDFKAIQAGEKGGLSMMMKVNQSQYASWTDVAGIRVFLHDKRELVYPESVSITVTPGTASSAVIARSETLRLGQPYGNCTDNKADVPSYYFTGPYMQEDNVQRVCGCMNPYYPIPSGKQACTLDGRKCVQKFDDEHADPNTWNCNCPMPCNQVDYLAGASRTDFRKNPTQCSTEQNATLRNNCIELFQHNRILIHVYYANIISIRFEEEELYPIMKLLSDTGGNIGLLYGISVITVIEFFFTVVMAIYYGTTNQTL